MSRSLYTQGQFITPKNLFYGETLLYESFSELFERMISQYGILLTRIAGGTYSNNALVSINGGTSIDIQAFEAIIKDADGITRQIKESSIVNIDMSNIGTYPNNTYNVLLQKTINYAEEGTIEFTYGSDQVVGTGTFFTKNIDKYMNLVIEGSGSGNNNKYEVLSVEGDENLTLRQVFTGTTEASLVYSVGGRFPDAAYLPSTLADYRIYQYDSYEIVITTNAATTGQYRIATVVKAGGVLTTVTDKRTADNNFVKFFPVNIDAAQIATGTIEVGRLPSTVVLTTGNQTIAGIKTFTNAPVVSVAGTSGDRVKHLTLVGDQVYPFISIGEGTGPTYWDIGYDSGQKLYLATSDGATQTDLVIFSPNDVTIKKPLILGEASAFEGSIDIYNATNAFKTTIVSSTTVSDKTITLPNLIGIVALTNAGQDFTDVGDITAVSLKATDGTVETGTENSIDGNVKFNNSSNAFYTLLNAPAPTANRTILLPDASGVIALLGDYVTVTANQTIEGLKSFWDNIELGRSLVTRGKLRLWDSVYAGYTDIIAGGSASDYQMQIPSYGNSVFVVTETADGRVRLGASFLELSNISSPSAPSATMGRIHMRDNGSGKVQLVVRFPTGATQIIATEP